MSDRTLLLSIVFFLNLIFPFIGWFFLIIIFSFARNRSKVEAGLVYFGLLFSLVFLGYCYNRLNDTGDVYQYALSLTAYKESLDIDRVSVISNLYEAFYPVWYFVLYLTSILGLDVNFINAISVICIYGSSFFIIYKLYDKYPSGTAEKQLIYKVLLFFSIFVLISSYKTMWAFSLVALGVFYLIDKKRIGWVFVVLGIGIHPVAIFPVFSYFISRVINFRIIYLYISLVVGVISKSIIYAFSDVFLNIPFIGDKVLSYIHGDWATYRFHEQGEFILFYLMAAIIFLICITLVLELYFIRIKEVSGFDQFLSSYNNFVFIYFTLSLFFISFRTIETRLIVSGFVFFIPVFYQVFLSRNVFQNKVGSVLFLVLWFSLIDIRYFNFKSDAYIVGSGFPYNLFLSPVYLMLNG